MAYCTNCGQQLMPGQKFCTKCGRPTLLAGSTPPADPQLTTLPTACDEMTPLTATITGKKRKQRYYDPEVLKQGVTLCDDGKYRWIYAMNMWKNPSILFVVLKIFYGIFAVGGIFVVIMSLTLPAYKEELWQNLGYFMLFVGFFTILILFAYSVVAAMYGGKYIVLFTMDEDGITHEQIPEQAKKAKKLGALTAAVGAGRGNLSMMGLGASVAARTSMFSDFKIVRSVKAYKWRNVIKVREVLSNNQVYARDEDFDFVYNYIKDHCPRVK